MKKDVGMRIRIDRQLRDEFVDACRVEDEPASAVLRRFMREYVASHAEPKQADLFIESSSPSRPFRGPGKSTQRTTHRDLDDGYNIG